MQSSGKRSVCNNLELRALYKPLGVGTKKIDCHPDNQSS